MKHEGEPYPITSLKEYGINEMEQSKSENSISTCIYGGFNGCHINGKWTSPTQSRGFRFDQTCASSAALSASIHSGPSDTQELLKFADPLFADKMKKYNVVGSNFVVVKDGKVLVNKGYGYANKEQQIPVDSQTVFQIASISKTFTALAAMQLVDEGKINLKHNIEEYLGGLKIPNRTGKPLTMFDLLTYTSGVDMPDITTYTSPEYVKQDIPTRDFLEKHMPTVVRPPGEAYVSIILDSCSPGMQWRI